MADKQIITANTNFMRKMNQSLVLDLIRSEEWISRADIAKRLKISKSTVSALVDDLIRLRLVEEIGSGSSTSDGGRRPTHLAFNLKAGYVVGIELGGNQMLLLISDLMGNLVFKAKTDTLVGKGDITSRLIAFTKESIEASGIPLADMIGIGVAVPGICDINNRIVLQAPSLNWIQVPLWDVLESEFNKPVYIDNDVNLAAMGERWIGAGKGVDNLLMVSFGTGVGAGIITDGKLVRGYRYSAGEIGYFYDVRDWQDEQFNRISTFGTYENRTSLHAVDALIQAEIDKGQSTILRKPSEGIASYDDLAWAAEKHDDVALTALDTVTTYMALGIANMASMLNPEVIIVGGEMEQAGPYLVEQIRRKLVKMVPIPFQIMSSTLKKEAEALGAIAIVLEDMNRLVL
ncbi:ROK family protein [Paenibacillus sp. LMG 31458]|uniref:ROK family protein n=1 Tax=Paenibacillus phytorum TaxID=2654977 RepID=A0ABX1Y4G6_9BACL|nr:ROK family transcriptional regulator [Paenibacillus phytorum]NOU75723.1 ROK family protein [Paenibacillus phytorum]